MSLTVEELSQAFAKDLASLLRHVGQNEQAAKLAAAGDPASRLKQAIRVLPALKDAKSSPDSADTSLALAMAMAVLERAFIESIEGSQLLNILKELILRMDHELMLAGNQRKAALNRAAVDSLVEKFFREVHFGTLD